MIEKIKRKKSRMTTVYPTAGSAFISAWSTTRMPPMCAASLSARSARSARSAVSPSTAGRPTASHEMTTTKASNKFQGDFAYFFGPKAARRTTISSVKRTQKT